MSESWVSRVKRLHQATGRITELELVEAEHSPRKQSEWVTIEDVIRRIHAGHQIYTCTPDLTGEYRKGSQIQPYLTTDSGTSAADNLEKLTTDN